MTTLTTLQQDWRAALDLLLKMFTEKEEADLVTTARSYVEKQLNRHLVRDEALAAYIKERNNAKSWRTGSRADQSRAKNKFLVYTAMLMMRGD